MLWTIGHSTRTLAQFSALLSQVPVDLVADVRSVPRSRANPQFNVELLPAALAADGIGYRHLRALGGLRGRRKDGLPSPNTLWRNAAFRNYADYAATGEFRAGLEALLALSSDQRCAIMCAEAVWWRCHRRIIADYLLAAGIEVAHILGPNQIAPASLTPGVRILGNGTLVYPALREEASKPLLNPA